MKNYTCFNYDFLFGDYMSQVSNEARLLYIKMNFYAVNGFVSNVKGILDSLGYESGVLNELISIGEILTLEGRAEIFITSYFLHNKGLDRISWLKTPYAQYWKEKLFIKGNGIATFNPNERYKPKPEKNIDPLSVVDTSEIETDEDINGFDLQFKQPKPLINKATKKPVITPNTNDDEEDDDKPF